MLCLPPANRDGRGPTALSSPTVHRGVSQRQVPHNRGLQNFCVRSLEKVRVVSRWQVLTFDSL